MFDTQYIEKWGQVVHLDFSQYRWKPNWGQFCYVSPCTILLWQGVWIQLKSQGKISELFQTSCYSHLLAPSYYIDSPDQFCISLINYRTLLFEELPVLKSYSSWVTSLSLVNYWCITLISTCLTFQTWKYCHYKGLGVLTLHSCDLLPRWISGVTLGSSFIGLNTCMNIQFVTDFGVTYGNLLLNISQ